MSNSRWYITPLTPCIFSHLLIGVSVSQFHLIYNSIIFHSPLSFPSQKQCRQLLAKLPNRHRCQVSILPLDSCPAMPGLIHSTINDMPGLRPGPSTGARFGRLIEGREGWVIRLDERNRAAPGMVLKPWLRINYLSILCRISEPSTVVWLVVSTHLENMSQNGNLPQVGVKIKNIWNHHLVVCLFWGGGVLGERKKGVGLLLRNCDVELQ